MTVVEIQIVIYNSISIAISIFCELSVQRESCWIYLASWKAWQEILILFEI